MFSDNLVPAQAVLEQFWSLDLQLIIDKLVKHVSQINPEDN